MNLRKFHRSVAITFSPFFLLSSLTGISLLFRNDEIYSKETKSLLIGLHNWEYGAKYIGAILGIGLIAVTISGIVLFIRTRKRS